MKIKNEKKALQMFCEEKGKAFDKPFINDKDNGRLLASDRKMMLLVKPELLQEAYDSGSQRLPNFEQGENSDIPITFANIDNAFTKFKLIPEKISKDGQPKECPECNGEGTVEYYYEADNGRTYYKEEDCPVCHGDGLRDDYELIETGRMVLPDQCYYQIKGVNFGAELINRAVEALRLMGFDSMTLKEIHPKNGNKFFICEGIELWIMPCIVLNYEKSQIVTLF